MIDSFGRSIYQNLVISPLLKTSFFRKLSPNIVTFIGLLCGILAFLFIVAKTNYLAIIFLILSGFFDTLDGSIARNKNAISNIGSAFDIFSDRVVEALVILGLYLQDPIHRGLVCILMLIAVLLCVTSFLVVGIFSNNTSEKSFHYSPGIIERFEAFCFFIMLILLPKQFIWISYIFSALVFITAAIRLWQFYFISKKSRI